MTRSSKYASDRPLADRVKHYFRGIFTDEEIDLSREKRNQSVISDETLDEILGRYVPEESAEAVEAVVEEPALELTDRKSVYFEPKVYAAAKDWAKEDGVSLGEYINKAVDNLNLANQLLKDMSKELDDAKAISSKYE